MTATQEARSTDGDLVIALNTPSTFTAGVAFSSSTGLPEPNFAWKDTVLEPRQAASRPRDPRRAHCNRRRSERLIAALALSKAGQAAWLEDVQNGDDDQDADASAWVDDVSS